MEPTHGKAITPNVDRGGKKYGKYDYEDFVVDDGGSFTISDTGAPWSRRLMSDTLRYQ